VKKVLTFEAQQRLIRPISQKKIKSTLFQMSPEKAPGQDGFNASFFQKNWDSLVSDIIFPG